MINIPKIPFLSKKRTVKIPIPEEISPFEKIKELIAPPGAEFANDYFQIGNIYGRAILILDYPSYLFSGWLEKLISLDEAFNITFYIQPIETAQFLKQLEKQLAKISGQMYEREKAGKVRDPMLEAAYKNVEELRDLLTQAQEKMIQIAFYLIVFANDKKELEVKTNRILKTLESLLIIAKPILFQQKDAFLTSLPLHIDHLNVKYHFNSSTASSFFPFIHSELNDETGIFWGVNLQNAGLVIIDRFNYENPHLTVLARSGAGKSYTTKLDVMRNLMMGNDVIILDPEHEYQNIAELYDGSFIPISLRSEANINPFHLPPVLENEDPYNVYKEHVSDLISLYQLLVGSKLSPDELAILDQAINQTYASFNITPDKDFSKIERFPTLNDLESILNSITGGSSLASKLYPYTQGNFSGFLNRTTNIELEKRVIIFGFKDLPEILRPIGMFISLNFILNRVRREIKRRVVIIDEAWWIMKEDAGANFLLNAIKRGRKYQLAVTTITQDVEDFLNSPYGRPIITNSALVFLMKQSPATIDLCGQVFALSEGEKKFLLQAERGEGLLLVGNKKIALYVLASYAEDQIIRTRPEQLIALKKARELIQK
jgi:type IV secretory pathway VirB4 component